MKKQGYILSKELYVRLTDLTVRARKINYKNKIPVLPKNPTESTMSGFYLRLGNWERILIHLENQKLLVDETKKNENLLNDYTIEKQAQTTI